MIVEVKDIQIISEMCVGFDCNGTVTFFCSGLVSLKCWDIGQNIVYNYDISTVLQIKYTFLHKRSENLNQ